MLDDGGFVSDQNQFELPPVSDQRDAAAREAWATVSLCDIVATTLSNNFATISWRELLGHRERQ